MNRFPASIGQAQFREVPEELTLERADLDPWDLRVTGTRKNVLSLWETDRWWSGSFTIPLSEALRAKESK